MSIATAADSNHIRFNADDNEHNSAAKVLILHRQKTPYEMGLQHRAPGAEPWPLLSEIIDSEPNYRFSITSPKRRSTVIRERTASSVSLASKRVFKSVQHWYYSRKEWILSRVSLDTIQRREKHQKRVARNGKENSSNAGEDAGVENGVFCTYSEDNELQGVAATQDFDATRHGPLTCDD